MVASQRLARRKKATRGQIVQVGIDLFAKHGLDAVTVERIADAADVGKGTIYNYFHTKEDIVVAFMTDLEKKVQAKLRDFDVADRPVADVLTEYVRMQFRMKRRRHRFVRVFFAQMFLHTEQFLPYMVEIYNLMAPNLAALFAALQARGAIRADISLPDLTLVFANVQFGLSAQWAIEGPPFMGTDYMLQREMAMFSDGLRVSTR